MGEGDSQDHSVFVGDLAADVTDYVLQEHFKRYFASVRSAKVITDPLTGRSKGYGFVRFGVEQERDRALGDMMGTFISNRPIRVSIATARKAPGAGLGGGISQGIPHPSDFDPSNTTLFIGGLSSGVTEEDLRVIFGQYGEIIYTKIPPGKGCGFVQFVQRPAAEAALVQLQGQVVGTSPIRLSWGRSSTTARAAAANSASTYPYAGAYGGAVPSYPQAYGASGYGALQQSTNSALDPYAAYAYALSQQAANAGPMAHQGPAQAAAPAPQEQQLGLNNSHPALRKLLAAQNAVPEQVDPLAKLDIDRLNAAYLQRKQASVLGAALHSMPATASIGSGPI